LRTDPRFESAAARVQHTRECIAALDELFAQRDLADWRVLLQRLSLPWTIVQTAGEAAVDPQVVANNFLVEIEGTAGTCPVVASPGQFDGRPPSLTRAPDHGEHTEEVLLELGRSWDDIVALKDAGAIL
jgi:crotonobetainyl-CoA:carnitine CoA-transferase CaiB-like acyl-CoA transferase